VPPRVPIQDDSFTVTKGRRRYQEDWAKPLRSDLQTQPDFWTWQSWVDSANDPVVGFPLQSLPWCAFASGETSHLGVAIGSFILDLHGLSGTGQLNHLAPEIQLACLAPTLNALMRCGNTAWSSLRQTLIALLRDNASPETRRSIEPLLIPATNAHFAKPIAVGDYTDFYASIHHATNVGKLFRPDQPLLPNYKWIPIGYHGRASSLVISGTEIRRPSGQTKLPETSGPSFTPTSQLDYELEVAAYIGIGNPLGQPVPIQSADQHIFGLSLLNDWSARDIQSWEYQPLGPFLGKSFATSISPFVIPMDALQPYRVAPEPRAPNDPEPLPYLASKASDPPNAAPNMAMDLTVEVFINTARMRQASQPPHRLSAGNLRDLYWTFPQMIAHHTSNGCNLLPGDLLASGAISGSNPGSQGCLLEITHRGANPIQLPNGEQRTFLQDGDEVTLRGFCEKPGYPRIRFGECRGTVVPTRTL
jgi:fumarylacetoacetase